WCLLFACVWMLLYEDEIRSGCAEVGGKVRLEAKEELHGRIGRSPDRADAVTMAVSPLLHQARRYVPLDAGFAAVNATFW
ncbi:MAG: hypothetical protein V3U13_04115, partial [Gemmatimonadota bacterium]